MGVVKAKALGNIPTVVRMAKTRTPKKMQRKRSIYTFSDIYDKVHLKAYSALHTGMKPI